MNEKWFELTTEQEFELKVIAVKYQELTEGEVKVKLLEIMEELMIADNRIKAVVKEKICGNLTLSTEKK